MVLGCGPAGLIAAHAAARGGVDVIILSRSRDGAFKSPMLGAQYLHKPIPGAPEVEFEIDYRLVGTTEGYRDKVYGPRSPVGVSPDSLLGRSRAWDIRAVYDWLWLQYWPLVDEWEASPVALRKTIQVHDPDVVVSTVPATLLCDDFCEFESQFVRITNETHLAENNVVLCSGIMLHPWYRTSLIQGYGNTEYPQHTYPSNATIVEKPIANDCRCFPDVVRAGRYGRWEKGVLAHEAYDRTRKAMGL